MKNSGACILVLTATFPRWPGDVGPAFIFDLCRELTAAGRRVTVLAPHTMGAREREVIDGIEVRRFRYAPESFERLAYEGGIMANLKRNRWLYGLLPLYLLAQFLALVRSLRTNHYDAIHAHWIVPQGVMLAGARRFAAGQPRCVCVAHGSDINALRGRFWSGLRCWVAARCDRLVAVSDALRERLVAEGCATDKIDVIPMGTDLQGVFVPAASPRAPAELLFVGRLVADKGVETLLQAIPEIRGHHPAVNLTVVGEGPERLRLEDLARRLNLASCVTFVGAVAHDALPAHYRRATLLVMPSRAEGFGLVAVEAIGCGCPVVASDLPALRGILMDGQAGALFRAGDPGELAKAVCGLLGDARRRTFLAEEGRRFILAHYDWQSVAQRYANLPEESVVTHMENRGKPGLFATMLRAFDKLCIAPRRYATGDDYDAARYWDDRFRRHGPSLSSVGHEGKSEVDNAAAYASQAGAIFAMLEHTGAELAGARVLEIGCGNGYYAEQLRQRGVARYCGLDITDAFFPLLRKRFPGFDFVRSDITSTRFPERFDVVLMIDVIEHIVTEEKLAAALANVSAMMADDAVFVLAPVVSRGRRSLFYVRFWTEAELLRALPGCQAVERNGRTLLLRRAIK